MANRYGDIGIVDGYIGNTRDITDRTVAVVAALAVRVAQNDIIIEKKMGTHGFISEKIR